tara:strand:- start:760 stop:1053 length:294 start_codon:yes stop_codon:yes gene_type:complete
MSIEVIDKTDEQPMPQDYMKDGSFDHEKYNVEFKLWKLQYRESKFKKTAFEEYGIDEETWQNTPDKIKVILADLHHEFEKANELEYDLQAWKDECPI